MSHSLTNVHSAGRVSETHLAAPEVLVEMKFQFEVAREWHRRGAQKALATADLRDSRRWDWRIRDVDCTSLQRGYLGRRVGIDLVLYLYRLYGRDNRVADWCSRHP